MKKVKRNKKISVDATLYQQTSPSLVVDNNVVINENSSFQVKEAYKVIRTNIMFSLPKEGGKSIVITSSMPSEGKTTTCVNLAITMAQTGAKVIIVDCDFRKPRVHKCLNKKSIPGMTNFLTGHCEMDTIICATTYENLDFIPVGAIPPNPTELLGSEKFKQILTILTEKYDYVFIDSPPVNVVTDVMTISYLTDGVLLIVRQDDSTHDLVQKAIEKLTFVNTKILGLILNYSSSKTGKYKYRYKKYGKYTNSDYGYGYKNGYGYGYGYGTSNEMKNQKAETDPESK